jgi:small subunit ribosomal protein S8
MVNDPIADFLIRIKNGYMAHKTSVVSPCSGIVQEIARILKSTQYIKDYSVTEDKGKKGTGKKEIEVVLKYEGLKPSLEGIIRVSKPGQRIYEESKKLPHVMTGYGMAIVSTSKGIMTAEEARKAKIGGEVLCKIW